MSIMASVMRQFKSIVNGDLSGSVVMEYSPSGRARHKMAKATLLRKMRNVVRDGVFVEILIWHVPVAVRGSLHEFKYSLALVSHGACVLRYDNEAGKGDHRHIGATESPYAFSGIDRLIADFRADVEGWLNDNPEGEDRNSGSDDADTR